MFMFAMAQVVATYSWPCIFKGAYFGRFPLLALRANIFSSSTCSQAMSRPAEPQQGSYTLIPGSGSMISAMIRATSGGVKNSPADWPLPSANLRMRYS